MLRAIVIALVLTVISCSFSGNQSEDDDSHAADAVGSGRVQPQPGTPNGSAANAAATLLFEKQYDVDFDGISIQNVRAWIRNAPNFSPTPSESIHSVSFEFDFEDAKGIKRNVQIGGQEDIVVDPSGWTYYRKYPTGSTRTPIENSIVPKAGTPGFVVSPSEGLLTANYPLVLDSAIPESVVSEDGFPWAQDSIRHGLLIWEEIIYEANTNLSQNGNLGCYIQPYSSAGGAAPVVEFATSATGHLDYDPVIFGQPASTERGENESVIAWKSRWYLAGANVINPEIRVFQVKTAQLWSSRSYPGNSAASAAPQISGIERLLQRCNSLAGQFPGSFRMFYQSSSGDIKATDRLYQCEQFELSRDLTTYPNECGWDSSLKLQTHGAWNGTLYDAEATVPVDVSDPAHVIVTTPIQELTSFH